MAESEPVPATPTPLPEPYVAGRSCDGCTMCCKVMSIEALAKPRQKWCEHCAVGTGCKIYAARPEECRTFVCSWLVDAGVGAHWAPRRSRMVLTYQSEQHQITIHVDGDRPDAWRKPPYRDEIEAWAGKMAANGGQVLVRMARDAVVILPGLEKNLGEVRDGQVLLATKRAGPAGVAWDVVALEPDDPMLKRLGR